MAHVFVVNDDTLRVHLQYMFAGIGAKDYDCDFLNDNSIGINVNRERLLVGMIADISRIKKGDNVLFYLQQTAKHEGMFFGSLKVIEEPFLCVDQYLQEDLGKKLTFRVKVKPDNLYSEGITERECLDSLDGINHPSQMCWSLIYRKLKGNRGCTMITDYEYKTIMKKIANKNKNKNKNKILEAKGYTYDFDKNKIIGINFSKIYEGKENSLCIKDRLIYKEYCQKAYEVHLQAYILQNIDSIDILKPSKSRITWIGNEVSCGVGMQSIDICFHQEDSEELKIVVCELKDEQPTNYIYCQMEKYTEWIKDYIVPIYNKRVVIYPTIVAPKPNEKFFKTFDIEKEKIIYKKNNVEVKPIKYVSYFVKNKDIVFKEEKSNASADI